MRQSRVIFLCGWLLVGPLMAATALSAGPPPSAQASFHLSAARGPIRPVDLSPPWAPVSSEILAGPTNGLDSAFVIYTRIAPGVQPAGLFTLPVEHTYLVLSGKLNAQIGTDQFVAAPLTLLMLPAGIPHRVWNNGPEPVTVFEVLTPAMSRDVASMLQPVAARKVDNAAQYVRVAPSLEQLNGGTGHDSLNERVLANRATGSDYVLERLNDVPPGGGRTEVHIHPFDQVYFVIEGTMTVQYGMKIYHAAANSLVVLPTGVVHSNQNNGTSVQRIVTLLLPEPEKGQPLGDGVTLRTPPSDAR